MIDYESDIFFALRDCAVTAVSNTDVIAGAVDRPSRFPCVAIQETNNYSLGLDSSQREKYAVVQYTIQVFSNKPSGKRLEAKKIFQSVDAWMIQNNFTRRSKYETPKLYSASAFEIGATYDAVIDENGHIFTRL